MSEIAAPAPLKGPIRPREIFFRRKNAPMTKYMRPRSHWSLVLFAFLSILFGLFQWWNDPGDSEWRLEQRFIAPLIPIWIMGEIAIGFLTALTVHLTVRRWQSLRRLPELQLTSLRPVAIAQLIIQRAGKRVVLGIIFLVWFGFTVGILRHASEKPLYLVPHLVLAINLVFTFHCISWCQVSISLWQSGIVRPALTMFHLSLVFAALLIPVALLIIVVMIFWSETSGIQVDDDLLFCLLPVPIALPIWVLKFLIARAHAARIEQIVMPRIEM